MPPSDAFAPDPVLVGLLAIAAGAVLWWLVPDMVRRYEQIGHAVLGRRSPLLQRVVRAYASATGRLVAVLISLIGVAVVVVGVLRA